MPLSAIFQLYHWATRALNKIDAINEITHTSLSPIRRGFASGFVNYKKGCTRLAATSDKVYQLLAHGRWFSPDTPASSTTKTGHHDIAEILLKVELKHKKSINQSYTYTWLFCRIKSTICKEYPSSFSIAKCRAVSEFSWNKNIKCIC